MENLLPEYVDHLIPYTDKQRTSLLRIHGQHVHAPRRLAHPPTQGPGTGPFFCMRYILDCRQRHNPWRVTWELN